MSREEELEAEVARLKLEVERCRTEARLKQDQLDRYAADLRETFREERARTQQLRDSYAATVRALANAVEARDAYTGSHAERVAAYGSELATLVDGSLVEDAQSEFGFLLHDIGKVAIPDGILHKPESLSAEEERLMRQHTIIGWEILRGIDFLTSAKDVVRSHHERWDGGGYPDGLSGENIPLAARIFSVADTFDAITTDRPYRPAAPISTARRVIGEVAGSQFDPAVVEAFMQIPDEVLDRIRTQT